ncbi:MAG: 3-deoxy-7-phosphoheptulonate synthase [Oscillospiraceae bacterium]
MQNNQNPLKASRQSHANNTLVAVGDVVFGNGSLNIIAGPCAVESELQILDIAEAVKSGGASVLRGGAFKPRTSPYSFQGLRDLGIELLLKAKAATGMPVVSEITSSEQLPLFEYVDLIQIGARNMQNFELLKALGHINKPVLLKRGFGNTIDEILCSAEYIMSGGNKNVILCERGIRTFETAVRYTLDISAVAILKERSHLPVIVDPSHAAGDKRLVEALCMASVAAGADGLIIEVHNDPAAALSDGRQAVTPDEFSALSNKITALSCFLTNDLKEYR